MDPKIPDAEYEEPSGKARGCCSCTAASCLSGALSRMSADVLHDFQPRQPRVTANDGHRVRLRIALVLTAAAAFAALITVQCTLGGLLQSTYTATAELPCSGGRDCHLHNPDWRRVQQDADARAASGWTCPCTQKRAVQSQLLYSQSFPCELLVQACFNESSPWREATFASNETRYQTAAEAASYRSDSFCGTDPLRGNASGNLQPMLQFCTHLRNFRDLHMPAFDAMPSLIDMYEGAFVALGRALQSAQEHVLAAAGLNGSLLPVTQYPPGNDLDSPLNVLQARLTLMRSVLLRIALSQGPYAAGLLSEDGRDVVTIEHKNSSILAWPVFAGGLHASTYFGYATRGPTRFEEDQAKFRTMVQPAYRFGSDFYMYTRFYSLAMPGNLTIDTTPSGNFDWFHQHYLLLTEQCMPALCTKVLPRRKVTVAMEALAFAGSLIALLFLIVLPLLWNWVIMPLSNIGMGSREHIAGIFRHL